MMSLRPVFGLLHRWVGLTIAGFLIVAGVTGAIISWDHELDNLLNPHLLKARTEGSALPALDLAKRVEKADPRIKVTTIPLAIEPGSTYVLGVEGRRNPETGTRFEPGYNQVFVDPTTGEEQGRRNWGAAWPITSENFVSFIYVLHYSLHIPEMWGINSWGFWLLGGVAILWTIDSFVGFYLTLPSRNKAPAHQRQKFTTRWRPAWRIKTSGSRFRLNFDIHRALGLWLWGLLFMLGFTAFSLNLYEEIFYPVMSKISQVTPTPFDVRKPADPNSPIVPRIDFETIVSRAAQEGRLRGWDAPVGDVSYSTGYGIYGAAFYHAGDDHGAAGVGPPQLYFDGMDGRLGQSLPWEGTAADLFVQAQFPLHSGRILGLPGRILISFMGLVVAALSSTGLVIWWRKRAARVLRARRKPRAGGAGREGWDLLPAE